MKERLAEGPPEIVPGYAHSFPWLDNFQKHLNLTEERRQRASDTVKHATVIGYVVPRKAAARVPEELPADGWNRLPAGTIFSRDKPRFVCTDLTDDEWTGVTVSELTVGAHLCNRFGRQLDERGKALDWYESMGDALTKEELAEHCPQLASHFGRTFQTLVLLVDFDRLMIKSAVLQHLSRVERYHNAVEHSACKCKVPLYELRFPEVKVKANGRLGTAQLGEDIKDWPARSQQLNPTLWKDQAEDSAPAPRREDFNPREAWRAAYRAWRRRSRRSVHEVERRYGPFLTGARCPRCPAHAALPRLALAEFCPLPRCCADVQETTIEGSYMAHVHLARLVHPRSSQGGATEDSTEQIRRAVADVLHNMGVLGEDATQPTQPAATAAAAGPSCPPSPPSSPPLMPSLPSMPPPSTPVPPSPPPSPAREQCGWRGARGAVPYPASPRRSHRAAPLPSQAPATATTDAPPPPPIQYTSSQYSDAATDVLLLSTIRCLETALYDRSLATEEQVKWVLASLEELWTVDPQGGALHFLFAVLEVCLSNGWDRHGIRAEKDLLSRTNFDPTKPAQAHRPKLTFTTLHMTAWFKDAAAAFHDSGARCLPTEDCEAESFDFDGYYDGFMAFVKKNAAADAESQKHSSLVLNLLVPALLLVKVSCLSPHLAPACPLCSCLTARRAACLAAGAALGRLRDAARDATALCARDGRLQRVEVRQVDFGARAQLPLPERHGQCTERAARRALAQRHARQARGWRRAPGGPRDAGWHYRLDSSAAQGVGGHDGDADDQPGHAAAAAAHAGAKGVVRAVGAEHASAGLIGCIRGRAALARL